MQAKKLTAALAALAFTAMAVPISALAAVDQPAGASPLLVSVPRLTMDSFNRLLKADGSLTKVLKRDRTLEMSIAASANREAIDGWLRRLLANEPAVNALKGSDMGLEEYSQTLIALLQATSVSSIKKQGRDVPQALERVVPPENLAFVQSHDSEIAAWMRQTGTGSAGPNTIEDLYQPPPEDAKAKDASTGTGSAPPANPPPAPSKP